MEEQSSMADGEGGGLSKALKRKNIVQNRKVNFTNKRGKTPYGIVSESYNED